jgi:hypothetical protein
VDEEGELMMGQANRSCWVAALVLSGAISAALRAESAHAAIRPMGFVKVVGTGTPASCTDAALRAAIAAGAMVFFRCGLHPARITVGETIPVATSTTLTGQGRVTLAGEVHRRVFQIDPGVRLILMRVTVIDG